MKITIEKAIQNTHLIFITTLTNTFKLLRIQLLNI